MAVCSLFNRMLLLTDLIPVHLVYCGQTVMIGCNHTSFEWTRAVRHIYGIIRHMQGLYCVELYLHLRLSFVWHHIIQKLKEWKKKKKKKHLLTCIASLKGLGSLLDQFVNKTSRLFFFFSKLFHKLLMLTHAQVSKFGSSMFSKQGKFQHCKWKMWILNFEWRSDYQQMQKIFRIATILHLLPITNMLSVMKP